jgi:uncharacterized protein (TIGR02147 family)
MDLSAFFVYHDRYMSKNMPSIFQYNNFRIFLKDYQEARYAVEKTFTKSFLCKMLGLPRTRSYFNDVLSGKEITETFVERFITLIGFTQDEAQFFSVLVKFNQTRNTDEREYYFDQLIQLNHTPVKIIDPKTYSFYKEWYHTTLRALLDIVNFKDNYAELAKRIYPPVGLSKIKKSIELMDQLGLIARNDKGYYKPTEKSIAAEHCNDELIKQYQIQCIELAGQSVLTSGKKPHLIKTVTMCISLEGYNRLEKHLSSYILEVCSLVNKDEDLADRVYQLNVQLFPCSEGTEND